MLNQLYNLNRCFLLHFLFLNYIFYKILFFFHFLLCVFWKFDVLFYRQGVKWYMKLVILKCAPVMLLWGSINTQSFALFKSNSDLQFIKRPQRQIKRPPKIVMMFEWYNNFNVQAWYCWLRWLVCVFFISRSWRSFWFISYYFWFALKWVPIWNVTINFIDFVSIVSIPELSWYNWIVVPIF